MADEKKRGRPKKTVAPVNNEEVEVVTMNKKTPVQQHLENGVGLVTEPVAPPDKITLGNIQARWRDVFRNYGSVGFEKISSIWNSTGASSALNNPFVQNARVKKISTPAKKLTKTELAEALEDPINHEMTLRSASLGLYYNNYIYQTLLQLNKNTPKYNYYANPLYLDYNGKSDNKKLKDDGVRVDKILRKFNPPLTLKTIANQVAIEGKCSYLVRTSYSKKDIDFLLLQKLNSDNVKITGFGSKQQFIASFNMVIFLEVGYDLSQYPKFIQDAWDEMMEVGVVVEDKRGKKKINPRASLPSGHMLEGKIDGSYAYWVKLPQDLCYTFYSDGAHPNAFPDTIGLFADLNDLDDYRWLQGSLLSKGINSVLTAEVPLV